MNDRSSPNKVETKYSISGLRRATGDLSFHLRLFIFVIGLAAGVLTLTWVKNETRSQIERLRRNLAAVPVEYFSLHDRLQATVAKLNRQCVDYAQRRDASSRDAYRATSRELQGAIDAGRSILKSDAERTAYANMEAAFNHYLKNMEDLLRNKEPKSGQAIGDLYQSLQAEAEQFHAAIGDLGTAQNERVGSLIHVSENTLSRLSGLLKLSILLLWILALFLAVVGYRGMIAPLWIRLGERNELIKRQEKLASLGVLAAGVAHEIRNPLTAIKFRLFSLKKSLPEAVENEDAKVVISEINRLDRIVKDFLQFARPSDPQLELISAKEIAGQISELMASALAKSGITLKTAAPADIWIRADAQQIQQVLINLIRNAADSIAGQGTVLLEVSKRRTRLDHRREEMVVLAVTDTGKGIPPEVEKRLFDPFFTTKEDGTGLGLAIATRIVEKHGGVLRYRTKMNHGTTFEIVLPPPNHHASEIATH